MTYPDLLDLHSICTIISGPLSYCALVGSLPRRKICGLFVCQGNFLIKNGRYLKIIWEHSDSLFKWRPLCLWVDDSLLDQENSVWCVELPRIKTTYLLRFDWSLAICMTLKKRYMLPFLVWQSPMTTDLECKSKGLYTEFVFLLMNTIMESHLSFISDTMSMHVAGPILWVGTYYVDNVLLRFSCLQPLGGTFGAHHKHFSWYIRFGL